MYFKINNNDTKLFKAARKVFPQLLKTISAKGHFHPGNNKPCIPEITLCVLVNCLLLYHRIKHTTGQCTADKC